MNERKRKRFTDKLMLVSTGILTYHCALYLSGQLDVRRLGDLHLLLMIGSALVITRYTAWVVRQPTDPLAGLPPGDSDRMTSDGLRVVRPSLRRYLTRIVSSAAWVWIALFVLERLGRNAGAEVPWPATNIWTPLALLGVSVVFFGTIGVLHLLNYRRSASPHPVERGKEVSDHDPVDRKTPRVKD